MGTRVFQKELRMGSTILFPIPRIWYGIARLVDLGAQLDFYNESLTPAEADALALYSDWKMVGYDLRAALRQQVLNHDTRMATR